MSASQPAPEAAPEPHGLGHDLAGLARGLGGALIFALPMLMTMEMWWLGFSMDRLRLVLLLLVNIPLLVALSHFAGFEKTFDVREDLRDAFIAYGIGILASSIVLAAFGAIGPGMGADRAVGMIALQAVPASLGALLARSQLGDAPMDQPETGGHSPYLGELFLMAVGALFLGLNVAPTEEVLLIACRMSAWHTLVLIVLSMLVMHGFVFAVGFRGGEALPEGTPRWSAALRFTCPGYVIAAGIGLYVLWTFGRIDGMGAAQVLTMTVVLGFPASVGAAAARLIL